MNPKAKPSCNVRNFKKTIRTNTKRLSCIYYKNETYLLCSSLYNIKITDSRAPAIWTCSKCYFRELSFISLRDIECVNESTDLPSSSKTQRVSWTSRSSHRRCSVKKSVLSSQNSQENTCVRVSFLIKLQVSGLQLY